MDLSDVVEAAEINHDQRLGKQGGVSRPAYANNIEEEDDMLSETVNILCPIKTIICQFL